VKLLKFLDHGIARLDNNLCDNAIRPFVVARKGFLFSASQASATATARLFSIAETAKANGIEPHGYFTHLFTRLPVATTLADFEALLPWNVKGLPTLRA